MIARLSQHPHAPEAGPALAATDQQPSQLEPRQLQEGLSLWHVAAARADGRVHFFITEGRVLAAEPTDERAVVVGHTVAWDEYARGGVAPGGYISADGRLEPYRPASGPAVPYANRAHTTYLADELTRQAEALTPQIAPAVAVAAFASPAGVATSYAAQLAAERDLWLPETELVSVVDGDAVTTRPWSEFAAAHPGLERATLDGAPVRPARWVLRHG